MLPHKTSFYNFCANWWWEWKKSNTLLQPFIIDLKETYPKISLTFLLTGPLNINKKWVVVEIILFSQFGQFMGPWNGIFYCIVFEICNLFTCHLLLKATCNKFTHGSFSLASLFKLNFFILILKGGFSQGISRAEPRGQVNAWCKILFLYYCFWTWLVKLNVLLLTP